jgi:hypothetical protein
VSDIAQRIGPEWIVVAHDADTVELRTGVWNSRTLTLHDESGSGKLWPMIRLIGEGARPKEVASGTGARTGEVLELLDQLSEIGCLTTGPRTVLDVYLDQAIRAQVADERRVHDIVLAGSAELVEDIHRALDRALTGAELIDGVIRRVGADDLLAGAGDEIWQDALELERAAGRMTDLRGALVVACGLVNDPRRYQLLDTLAAEVGFTWIHATVDGPFVFVGPTIVPGQTSSYRDFEQRVSINLRERESYLRYKNAMAVSVGDPSRRVVAPVATMLAAHTAMEAMNYVACSTNATLNKVLSIYLPTMEIAYQEVLPVPGSTSGSVASRDALSLYFDSREWLVDERLDNGEVAGAATSHRAGR